MNVDIGLLWPSSSKLSAQVAPPMQPLAARTFLSLLLTMDELRVGDCSAHHGWTLHSSPVQPKRTNMIGQLNLPLRKAKLYIICQPDFSSFGPKPDQYSLG